jgi:hypothetical protein
MFQEEAMRAIAWTIVTLGLAVAVLVTRGRLDGALAQRDPLPSWNDGGAKKSITDFVAEQGRRAC